MEEGLLLFDSNIEHPLNQLSLENQKYIISITMHQFREFPLCGGGYDEEELRFYDGVLGGLIRTRDRIIENNYINLIPGYLDFCSKWEYHGDIYRVIDKAYVCPKNREPYMRMPSIRWHGMVASWSSSYDFTKGFNKIGTNTKYTIIHANTGDSAGIDVNKFSQYLGSYNQYTACENEIIFPMKKGFVVKVYKNITPTEFKSLMERGK
ncbi:hypothetical protein C7U55_05270 [Faecalibacillus faecis]|mgnify:CR=1 FL=1|uniref:Uncharacterized protein n=1 Tax=Faecalibacillus faecis TaxID=1982628 RepID=A0A2T3G0M4_9FIRM|nr:hypothetical protein [Faecalibacillus faecis]PST41053.1 hypothetical protein C7U55_05270 [Faecalibacillus faecis]